MTCMQYIQTHLSLNRVLLLTFGLWPYQQSKLVPFQFGLFFGILTTFILFQLGVFITSTCTVDLTLKIFFTVFLLTSSVISYASFYVNNRAIFFFLSVIEANISTQVINAKHEHLDVLMQTLNIKNQAFKSSCQKLIYVILEQQVKSLIEQIQRNYDELKDKNEITIMDGYANKTKRHTTIFTVFAVFGFCAILFSQLWSCILDIILPTNQTRSIHTLQFINEYLLDREKHFYLYLLHANVAVFISCFTILSTGTMLLVYGQHICAMFRIASYRIQRAMNPNATQPTNLQEEKSTHERITYAVDIHRKTLQFAEFLMSTFTLWFFLLIGAGVISSSLNLLLIYLMLSSEYDVEELIIQVLFLVTQYLYMFMGNYVAQEITNHSDHVFINVYNTRWYFAPVQIQKMILFILQKGNKSFTLQLGGLFVGSLEGFTTLISASVSYFTFIYATQQ